MISLKTIAPNFSSRIQIKKFNKINLHTQYNSGIIEKAHKFVGASAIGAIMMGAIGLSGCSKDDYLGELLPKTIHRSMPTDNISSQDSISVTQSELINLATPSARLSYISNDLNIDNPTNYIGNRAAVTKITNGKQYDEIYLQRAMNTSNNQSKLILNGINIHRNTENTNTNDTGSTFGMVVTNLDDGSIVIKKEYFR